MIKKYLEDFEPMLLLVLGMAGGVLTGIQLTPKLHTEKAGCECVEQTQCVQRWVRDE